MMLKLAHFTPHCPVALKKMFLEVCQTRWYETKKAKCLFHWTFAFFVKLLFPTKSYVLQKVSPNLHSICVKELRSPKVVSGCSQTRWYEKLSPIFFISLHFCLFFKNLCLQQSLTCYKIYLKPGKTIAWIFFWA